MTKLVKANFSHCAPSIDTKFAATFGDPNQPCQDGVGVQGCDFVDMSVVDGWTLPFKFKVSGTCSGAQGAKNNFEVDCSQLSLDACPEKENLAAAGFVGNLRAVNPHTKQVAGCYAPCQKLTSRVWNNTAVGGHHREDPQASPYCCASSSNTLQACRSGPMAGTEFLKAVHSKCPGLNAYEFDAGLGVLHCTPQTVYELTFFCPDGRTNYSEAAAQARARLRDTVDEQVETAAKEALEAALEEEHEKKAALEAAWARRGEEKHAAATSDVEEEVQEKQVKTPEEGALPPVEVVALPRWRLGQEEEEEEEDEGASEGGQGGGQEPARSGWSKDFEAKVESVTVQGPKAAAQAATLPLLARREALALVLALVAFVAVVALAAVGLRRKPLQRQPSRPMSLSMSRSGVRSLEAGGDAMRGSGWLPVEDDAEGSGVEMKSLLLA